MGLGIIRIIGVRTDCGYLDLEGPASQRFRNFLHSAHMQESANEHRVFTRKQLPSREHRLSSSNSFLGKNSNCSADALQAGRGGPLL